jgi:hypothetical protein
VPEMVVMSIQQTDNKSKIILNDGRFVTQNVVYPEIFLLGI